MIGAVSVGCWGAPSEMRHSPLKVYCGADLLNLQPLPRMEATAITPWHVKQSHLVEGYDVQLGLIYRCMGVVQVDRCVVVCGAKSQSGQTPHPAPNYS